MEIEEDDEDSRITNSAILNSIVEPIFMSRQSIAVGKAVAALMLVPLFLSFFLYLFGIVSDAFVMIVIVAEIIIAAPIVVIINIASTKVEKRIEQGDPSPPGRFIKICYGALLGAMAGIVGLFLILLAFH